MFDTGGGSSQFTFGHGERVDERFSVNVGAARFTERYGLDAARPGRPLAAALDAIAADLARLDGRPAPDTLVGMGGAVTNLTAVKHGLASTTPTSCRAAVLDRAEIDRQIELYRTRTAEQRREIVGLQPKRAEVILAGACIVRTVLAKLGGESLTVSDRGLRHGLLVERFGPGARLGSYDDPEAGASKGSGSGGREPVSLTVCRDGRRQCRGEVPGVDRLGQLVALDLLLQISACTFISAKPARPPSH